MTIRAFSFIPNDIREWSRFFQETQVIPSNDSVSTDILKDASVTTPKIAALNVTGAKIASDAISSVKIQDNAVTGAKLRDSAALSVIGQPANMTGDPADIASTLDGQFLVRRASALGWAALLDADIPAAIARDSEVSAGDATVTAAYIAADAVVTSAYIAADAAHVAAGDPHSQYLTQTEGDARYSQLATGTFTGTLTGCATSPTGTLRYTKAGNVVVLYVPQINGTSTSTGATVTGAPAAIQPARQQIVPLRVQNNSVVTMGWVTIETSGVLTLSSDVGLGLFTALGTKGTEVTTITFSLD